MLHERQQATRLCGSFLPLRARGTTKSTDMASAFSKLARPSSPQYWQRYSSRSRICRPSFLVTGLSRNLKFTRSNDIGHLLNPKLWESFGFLLTSLATTLGRPGTGVKPDLPPGQTRGEIARFRLAFSRGESQQEFWRTSADF